jgi:hypothetical protein
MPFPGRGFLESERVFYPLSDDGRMVDCILALHRYPDLPIAIAADWHVAAWRRVIPPLEGALLTPCQTRWLARQYPRQGLGPCRTIS